MYFRCTSLPVVYSAEKTGYTSMSDLPHLAEADRRFTQDISALSSIANTNVRYPTIHHRRRR